MQGHQESAVVGQSSREDVGRRRLSPGDHRGAEEGTSALGGRGVEEALVPSVDSDGVYWSELELTHCNFSDCAALLVNQAAIALTCGAPALIEVDLFAFWL